ncbi:MAG: hypothetical protein ACE5JD_11245 [Candidatus Methylomirabilia bacterium]
MAEEGEISKRIDDLHRRFDDLRGYLDRRLEDFRADMAQRFGALAQRFEAADHRLGDLRGDLTSRLEEVNHRLDGLDKRLDALTVRLDALAGAQQSAFRWTITTVVALFGIAVPVWMWVLSLVLRPLLR